MPGRAGQVRGDLLEHVDPLRAGFDVPSQAFDRRFSAAAGERDQDLGDIVDRVVAGFARVVQDVEQGGGRDLEAADQPGQVQRPLVDQPVPPVVAAQADQDQVGRLLAPGGGQAAAEAALQGAEGGAGRFVVPLRYDRAPFRGA